MSVAKSPRLKKQDRYDWDHRVRAENPHAFRKNWPKKKARSRRIGRHRENTAIIQWDEDDQIFVVSLPEWGSECKTRGATYEEAAKNAREVLELLMEDCGEKRVDLPAEEHFRYLGTDVVDLQDEADAKEKFGMLARAAAGQLNDIA